MIIVMVSKEKINGVQKDVVSHGIDAETDKIIHLPQVHPSELGAKFSFQIGEYVII